VDDDGEPLPPLEEEREARLRAIGVKPASAPWRRDRIVVRQRPAWLAFIFRTLRLDRV